MEFSPSLTLPRTPGYALYVLNSRKGEGGSGGSTGSRDAARRDGARRRSYAFLERDGERWSVFLATYAGGDGRWRGYFTFRTAAPPLQGEEIRTADLFVEHSEAEVDARARGLGRPLLGSLLESALHTHDRSRGPSPNVGRWFREVLASRSEELAEPVRSEEDVSLDHLRSLYDSYRIDQVSHLIALIEPAQFRALVDQLLEGREIDFRASDRLQLAMIVVQDLERHLPLPPFEVWAEDYMDRRDVYQRYSHDLHREGTLPE